MGSDDLPEAAEGVLLIGAQHLAARAARARPMTAAALLFLVVGLQMGTWSSRIPQVKEATGVGSRELGQALFASGAGILLGIAVVSVLVRRTPGAALVGTFGTLQASMLALIGTADDRVSLVVTLLLYGIADGALTVLSTRHGVLVEHQLGRPVMSFLFGMISVGALLGAGVGALAVWNGVGHRLHFAAAAVVVTVLSIGFWALTGPPPTADRSQSAGPAADRPRNRRPHLLVLLVFLVTLTVVTLNDWSALYFIEVLGASPRLAALAPTVVAAALAAGRLAGGVLTGRLGPVAVVGGGALLGCIGVVLLGVGSNVVLALVGCALAGAGVSCVVPLLTGAAAADRKASSAGVITAASCMPYLVGPPLVGYGAEGPGLHLVFLALAVPLSATALTARLAVGSPDSGRDGMRAPRALAPLDPSGVRARTSGVPPLTEERARRARSGP